MKVKTLLILLPLAVLTASHGCYEEVDIPDYGICEPRLTSIEDILEPLEQIAVQENSFHNFFEDSYDQLIKRSPEWAVELGLEEDLEIEEAELDDLSTGYRQQTFLLVNGILDLLRKHYVMEDLTPDNQITYSSYEWYLDDWAKEEEFMHHYYPFTQRSGPQFRIFGFFRRNHPVESLEQAENYIIRLDKVKDKLACLRENIEISRERGYLPPKFMVDYNIEALDNLQPGVGPDLSMYYTFDQKLQDVPDIDDNERERLLAEALDAIENSVIPAYGSLVNLLQDLEEAPEQAGVGLMPYNPTGDDDASELPNGEDFYAHTLANHTTTDMTADEIHNLGLSEVERIQEELMGVFDQLGYPEGLTMLEYFEQVGEDGGYASAEEVPLIYEGLIEDALADLSPAFDLTIENDVIFVCDNTPGYYIAGSLDGTEPGEFHSYCDNEGDDLPQFPMPTLAYHEAVPGHHYQISIAQEIGLPDFRVSGATAYVEGWALYTERLAKELGWYDKDIYGDIGRLRDELLRAVRLVVDTGLHVKGWTRDEATDYMVENAGFDEEFSAGQMDRYAAWPGQSTAYKIGMMKILELRDMAMSSLGKDFDIIDFHRYILLAGSIPLVTLEQVVQNYADGTYKSGYELDGRVHQYNESSPVRFAMPRPQLKNIH